MIIYGLEKNNKTTLSPNEADIETAGLPLAQKSQRNDMMSRYLAQLT